MKKLLAFSLVMLMLFGLVACGGGGGGGTDYKAAVELMINSKYGIVQDKLETIVPAAYWTLYEQNGMPRSSLIDEAKWNINETYKSYSEYLGDFTATVEITESTKGNLDKVKAMLEEQKGIKASDVTDAYELKLTVKLTGTSGTASEDATTKVVKISGSWYCVDWMIYDEGGYITFELENMPMYG